MRPKMTWTEIGIALLFVVVAVICVIWPILVCASSIKTLFS